MANQNSSKYDANGYNARGRRQIKGFSQTQHGSSALSQAQGGANELYSSGVKVGRDGQLVPTRAYGGTVAALSQQRNSLSPSGGSRPMNDMYLDDPTFFNRRPGGSQGFGGDPGFTRGGSQGFGEMLGQTREQRIAQAQQEGTFGTIRDKFNQDNSASGRSMNKFGNIMVDPNKPQSSEWLTENRPVQFDESGLPKLPWAGDTAESGQRVSNRQALEQAAAGIKLRREASGELPTVTNSDGIKRIEGKYGHGASTRVPSAGGEGMIGKQKFSEVMQGLANKPGVASPGDRFQPQQWNNLKRTKK